MKKLKFIIPSLGLLLLSTVATVSGSLAWFTANRAIEFGTTNFQVQSMEGSLSATLAAKAGVTVDNATQMVTAKGNLTHGSFDHVGQHFYTFGEDADENGQPDNFTDLSDFATATDAKLLAGTLGATSVYYACAWTVTTTYSFNSDDPVDLFFSPTESLCTLTAGAGEFTKHAKTGFRLAFICESEKIVWAPYHEKTELTEESKVFNYINGTTAASKGTINKTSDLILGNGKTGEVFNTSITDKALDKTAGNATRVDHLGQFVRTTKETLVVNCVAWFEGEDAGIVNETTMDAISATLKFYTRKA